MSGKNRETEVNYKKLQTQMNEYNIQKKLLHKKIKTLEQNLIDRENYISENFADIMENNKNEDNNKKVENNENEKTAPENEETHENNSNNATNRNKNNESKNDNE